MIREPDKLKTPLTALIPDARISDPTLFDLTTGEYRGIKLEEQHQLIACFVLNNQVPDEIKIHFETAKNCYLYSWFVYRFYQVAEQQACATLEFALRERFPEFVEKMTRKKKDGDLIPPGFGSLLEHAKLKNVLRNDLFPSRFKWAKRKAKDRYSNELLDQAMALGIEEYEFDDSHIQPTEEDLATDWLSNYIKYLPKLRNLLAHGSEHLRDNVWHTFDIVCSMINMLYPEYVDKQ